MADRAPTSRRCAATRASTAWFATSSVTAGQTYSFTFTTSGMPAATLTAANLPGFLTFTPEPNGTGVLSGSSTTATTYDNLEIIANNAAGSATQTFNLTVNPAAFNHLAITAPEEATAGTSFNFTVTAEDQYGNTVGSYADTLHFTSTDATATLPANSALTDGTATLSATLDKSGSQTITATDTTDASITATSNTMN